MRANDMSPYCPDCQGDQVGCSASGPVGCVPVTPCYGATPASLVTPDKFNGLKNATAPDGTPWIEQNPSKTTWCPGETYAIRYHILADHNGVYRWESSLGAPGSETEESFVPFTDWVSFNADANTKYYHEDSTEWDINSCINGSWSPHVTHCKDQAFAETHLTIPSNLPQGETVVRWIWFGALQTDGTPAVGPEPSLFANCVDIVVGGESCTPAPITTPSPSPSGDCPGGSMGACVAACSVVTGDAHDVCISVCKQDCPTTTTATTTAAPSPSPSPSGCPGGSLSACISGCPTNPAVFAVCVASCEEECTTTTPAPAPAGMCCWQDCETMSTCLPSDACSNDSDACRSCSGIWCPGSAFFLV